VDSNEARVVMCGRGLYCRNAFEPSDAMPLKLLQQAVCSSAVQIGAVMARLVCGCMASDWLGCERMERRTSARVAVALLRFGWQDVYVQSVRHTMHGPCYQVDLIMEKASLTGATAAPSSEHTRTHLHFCLHFVPSFSVWRSTGSWHAHFETETGQYAPGLCTRWWRAATCQPHCALETHDI
jgi:hypothetical protein